MKYILKNQNIHTLSLRKSFPYINKNLCITKDSNRQTDNVNHNSDTHLS